MELLVQIKSCLIADFQLEICSLKGEPKLYVLLFLHYDIFLHQMLSETSTFLLSWCLKSHYLRSSSSQRANSNALPELSQDERDMW